MSGVMSVCLTVVDFFYVHVWLNAHFKLPYESKLKSFCFFFVFFKQGISVRSQRHLSHLEPEPNAIDRSDLFISVTHLKRMRSISFLSSDEYNRHFVKTLKVRIRAPTNQRRAIHSVLTMIPEIEGLKPEQKECLVNFIKGKDVIALLPTGFGKSLKYWLTPLVAHYIGHNQIPATG
ncbi:hypothetical protein NL108_015888 [Boleophthalmus pectinirostris]|nr:hypothetical protein NL108_015888 [Boleophthalmus pectinirostris]